MAEPMMGYAGQPEPLELPGETWRPVPGFDGYSASTLGRIRGDERRAADGRKMGALVMRQRPDDDGYMLVTLWRDGRPVTQRVNRLVLLAHRGEPRRADYEAKHRNHRRADNRLSNLSWGSRASNARERERHKRQQRKRTTPGVAVTDVTCG